MFKKSICLVLVLILGILFLTSCTSKDKYADDIIGKWECKCGNETLVFVFEEGGVGTARHTPAVNIKDVKIKYVLDGEKITITSYPIDDQGVPIGKAIYEIRYYKGEMLFRPVGSTAKAHYFYRVN